MEYSRHVVPDAAEAYRAQFIDEEQVPVTLVAPAIEPGQPVALAPETRPPSTDD
jgi:hypothetical protein